ncbi:uracil-DNA glycosylase family protein [Halorhabdus amylolytica]|uniref:uracil-DNA glycosylase family protein n=1 Tax=Halorhabdus amylolytica TaxID=2559573 RepID=UPI0020BD9D70|nr:uracil-DNA glycosylase family protein [Halorhabdus amylolytica]
MTYVADIESNPFGYQPDCERFVPGFGDVGADFHVIGDHPGAHGGVTSGIPFTETPGAEVLQRALLQGGLLRRVGTPPTVASTYLSYLHLCVPESTPTDDDYRRFEVFIESEVRAIAAHVLLPVGERATKWVFENMTTRSTADLDMQELHATEVIGSGWLVMPIADPRTWTDGERQELGDALTELQARDFRREADLGRLVGGDEPYFVR